MISIILPVYNGTEFLKFALDSVRTQTYPDFECICIDDGSSDGSREVVRRVADEDSRFRLIVQENQGVAAARNRGMGEACGDFITFLDQDDALAPDALRRMLTVAEDTGCEVVAAAISEFISGKTVETSEDGAGEVAVSSSPFEDFFGVGRRPCVKVAVWGKLYAKSALKNIAFPVGVFGADDYVFTARFFSVIDRYAKIAKPLYLYRMHENNVTMQMPMRYILGMLKSSELVWDEILKREIRLGKYRKSICRHFSKGIISCAIKKTCRNVYSAEEMAELKVAVKRLYANGVMNFMGVRDHLKLRFFLNGRIRLLRLFFPSCFRKK
ncbi:MAG: glycosyltransferase family 2 protein [Kiritimatiellae bacterium]|nr:glycosyltransferase family 2 protein [Kiritimatiellia bacterium]